MGQIVAGADGIGQACRELGTPVVSGNVSLYNQTDGTSVRARHPMIGMVGKHKDVRKALPAVSNAPAKLYLFSPRSSSPSFGGSLLAREPALPL
jgi:phosphoribosylformylglycinamidine synthase